MTATGEPASSPSTPDTLLRVAELFLDDRGQALRVTWHAEAGLVVLSIWKADECVGTVRLAPEEAHRLAGFLDEAVSAPVEAPTS